MPVRRDSFRHTAGGVVCAEKTADSGRIVRMFRCARCGAKIWNQPLASPDILVLKPATLDDPRWAAPVANIWTDARLAWIDIDPSLLDFPRQPPDRQPLYDAWAAATGRSAGKESHA